MTPCMVHATIDQDIVRQFRGYRRELLAWRTELATWAQRHGITSAKPIRRADGRVCGFEQAPSEPVPAGWRRTSTDHTGLLVPNVRCLLGRRIARELGALQPPANVRDSLPGIVTSATELAEGRRRRRMITYRLELRGVTLYAVWQGPVSAAAASPPTWQPVPLADYRTLAASGKEAVA